MPRIRKNHMSVVALLLAGVLTIHELPQEPYRQSALQDAGHMSLHNLSQHATASRQQIQCVASCDI